MAGRWRRGKDALQEELPEQVFPLAQAAEVQDQKPCERHAGPVEDTDKTKPEVQESLAQPAHSGPSTSSVGESRWRRNAASAEAETRRLTPSSFVLLRSGLRVPVLGLGTRQLKGAECREAVRMALRSGYRLIDTAPGFGNEEEIANGIRAAGLRREDVFLVTKLSPAEHGDAEEVEEALHAALQRLGTGYIDLFLIQSPQGGSVIWTWDAVLAVRDRGLARAVGVCNFSAAHLAGLAATGRELPEVLQVELHLAQQQQELTAHCARNGIAVMAASPLARGQLCRSSHGSFPDAWRSLAGMAAKKGRNQAEIAVRWCLQKGYVALPKSKSQGHLEANAAFGFDLTSAAVGIDPLAKTIHFFVFAFKWLLVINKDIDLSNSQGNSIEDFSFFESTEQETGKALPLYLDPAEFSDYLRGDYFYEILGDELGSGSETEMARCSAWLGNMSDYPLRLYFERLKLWYRIYEGDDTMVGPLVAGRLQGKAQRLGMQLRLPRPDGGVDGGSDALVRLSVDEVRDPSNPNVVIQHAIPSGIQALCNSVKDAFGVSDQEMVSQSIEAFFEFKRGKLSFQEYAIEFDIRLEEAVSRAGLDLNDVAKFYLFFRGSGLPYKFVEDIKLQLQGDLRRYQEARALALRLITKKDDSGENYFEDTEPGPPGEEAWDSPSWIDEGWSWIEETSPSHRAEYWQESSYYDEPYYDGIYYDEDYEYYENEGWNESWEEPANEEPDAATSAEQTETSESYPLKGKNKRPGCSACGSRWHSSGSCPVASNSSYGGGKGKGKPKGYGSPGGWKGKSKKGFGKGKGKGKWMNKGKGSKGRGKGYHGYVSEKTLVGSFGESRGLATPPKAKVVHSKLDHDDSPVLPLGARTKAAEATTGEKAEAAAATSSLPKTLDFTFATGVYSDSLSYHTILGEKRWGLLVDPGAASGLVGSETLRDLMEHCLPGDQARTVQLRHDRTSVSGINGTPEQTLGEVSLPLRMLDMNGTFSAEVIGGEGSLCPALLSNPALRKQSAAILTNHFENGDGVLILRDGRDNWKYLHILLADSGH
ncbi:unnamed protein product [Symbiodinium sp. CCMP2592]|nr:unnamed protein product [Symbiodinium sp. CCMP2592]